MLLIKLVLRWLLGLLFVAAGVNHFVDPAFYVRIMPPYLPWHLELVYLSGVFEIVLGVLLLISRFTVLAAWGLIALLIAIFPANIHLAMNPQIIPEVSPTMHLLRLPLQAVLITWAWWFTKPANLSRAESLPK